MFEQAPAATAAAIALVGLTQTELCSRNVIEDTRVSIDLNKKNKNLEKLQRPV